MINLPSNCYIVLKPDDFTWLLVAPYNAGFIYCDEFREIPREFMRSIECEGQELRNVWRFWDETFAEVVKLVNKWFGG
jgi:hypothetical protein